MALSGSLAEFSVAEVLQLLALQQKSGVLTLTHDDGRGYALFFERGKILAAADRRREDRSPFLDGLLHNHIISREQLETVEDIARETNQDIFTILLTTGVMGRDRLGEEMHRFTQRVMDDLVGWMAGHYEFSGDERSLPHQGLSVKVGAEELLMESMRRNDELTTMKDNLLSPGQVLAKSPNPPREPLPRECQVVLALIDGRRTVDEVCRRSPMGDYLTYDAITELLGRQQVIVLDPDQAADIGTERGWSIQLSPVAWAALLAPLVLSFLLGAVAGPLLERGPTDTGWMPEPVVKHRAEYRDELRAERAKISPKLTR